MEDLNLASVSDVRSSLQAEIVGQVTLLNQSRKIDKLSGEEDIVVLSDGQQTPKTSQNKVSVSTTQKLRQLLHAKTIKEMRKPFKVTLESVELLQKECKKNLAENFSLDTTKIKQTPSN